MKLNEQIRELEPSPDELKLQAEWNSREKLAYKLGFGAARLAAQEVVIKAECECEDDE